jgi:hypothetical protein
MAFPLPQTRVTTLTEFEAYIAQPDHADRLFELVDGEIFEKLPASGVEKRLHGINDVIDFSSVIPGFTMPVPDIFHDPLEEEA